MTSKSAIPTAVRQLRIIFCPRCKSSSGMRSFLKESLPTLKRSIAENSKNPKNPTTTTSKTVLMIRECNGAPPQALLKLEGSSPEQQFTFTDLNSRAIKTQLAAFFPQLNSVPPKEVKGRAGRVKSLPRGADRARANALEASKVASAKADQSSKQLEPLPAKVGSLKNGKKKPNGGAPFVYLDRAAFHAARKAGIKGRPAKNLDFKVVFGASQTTPPSACNAFWSEGNHGPEKWSTVKLNGPKRSVFDESGISKRRPGLPKAACNAFWGAGRQGPSSWEVKKSKAKEDERASWSKIPKKKKGRSSAEKGGSSKKEPTIVPEPACNQFWGSGEKGPKSWSKPEAEQKCSSGEECKILGNSAAEDGWLKWTLEKLCRLWPMSKKKED